MLSRVAESLFWTSRYVERAENVARLLDIGLDLELDAGAQAGAEDSSPVELALNILACREAFEAGRAGADRAAVLEYLTFDRRNPQSILGMVGRARENARSTQEAIGVDLWKQINRLYLYLCGQRARRRFVASPSGLYATIKYLQPSPLVKHGPELDAFLDGLPTAEGSVAEVAVRLMSAVRSRLVYEKTVTTGRTPVVEALRLGRGACQDFSHLFLAGARGIGLPARYVSGYIHLPGEVETHAWCQVWDGRGGWVDVDPTHNSFPADDYVKIGIGRDYSDVPPNRGVWKGRGQESIAVSVKIEAIDRVPPDWGEWSTTQSAWSSGAWLQSERHGRKVKGGPSSAFRQQQGQQQQGA